MTAAEYLKQGDGEWVQISCAHCGQSSGWEKWTRTEVSGPLPADEFQCPKCTRAFARRRSGRESWYPQIVLVPIPSRF